MSPILAPTDSDPLSECLVADAASAHTRKARAAKPLRRLSSLSNVDMIIRVSYVCVHCVILSRIPTSTCSCRKKQLPESITRTL